MTKQLLHRQSRLIARSIGCSLWLLFAVASCWAQTGTGNIQGVVKDTTGAVVPKAHIALVHTATNRQYSTESNEVGFYLFPSVELGDYQLAFSSAGMQTWKAQLHLSAGQTAEVEAVLKPGSAVTTVEVSSDVTPLVTTTSATLATVVEPERIQQLPVNGRLVDQLLFMTTPGAVQDAYSSVGAYRVPEIYGLRFASVLTQDGAPLEDRAWGTEPNRPPGMDTIAEFRAETNNSSAKFDRPGTFIMTTKSGSNQIHGSMFETARNSGLGVARSRTDFYAKPPHMVRNEFGVSLGGPVWLPKLYDGRNKTFFFVAYEGMRQRQNTTGSASVPTAAQRNGDFSGLLDSNGRLSVIYDPWSVAQTGANTWTKTPFAGNAVPAARQSALGKYLNSITPLPTIAAINPLLGANWYGPIFANQNQYTFTTKVDQRLSERDHLSARFSHSPSTLLNGSNQLNNAPPTLDGKANVWGDFAYNNNGVANWTHTFSPTFFAETLITFSRDYAGREPLTRDENISKALGLPNPFNGLGFPRVNSDGFGYSFDSGVNIDKIWTNSYIFNQDFTKVKGRHELQFGVRLRLEKYNELEDQQTTQGELTYSSYATALQDPTANNAYSSVPYTGSSAADFLMGVDATYNNRFNRQAYPYRQWEAAAYFQDNFNATSRLTLNLGMRYEYINPIQVTDHSLLGFDVANKKVVLGTTLDKLAAMGDVLPSAVAAFQNLGMQFETAQQAGLPSTLIFKNPYNFDPRVGFAYRTTGGTHPVVVRGGYGIFQFNQPLRMTSGYGYASSPQSATLQVSPENAATSPDGLSNYLLRSAPAVIAGVNSANLMDATGATGIVPGKAYEYFTDPHLATPRAHEWNLTIEKEVMANTLLSFGYIGTHASNLGTEYSINDPMPTYLWYLNTRSQLPTGTYANVATNAYDQKLYGQMYDYKAIGWSNNQSFKVELEHRYSKGYAFQVFYVMSNALAAGGQSWYGAQMNAANQYLPGAVPSDLHDLLRLQQYARDNTVPKHLVRWNWVVDLPIGRNKLLGKNMNRVLDKVVGGWQVAGFGSVSSNWVKLYAKNWGQVGKVQVYGTKYPVQDCTSGVCYNAFLYDNGYISPKILNAHNAAGHCTGICGVPADYAPYNQPLIPWGSTTAQPNMPANTNLASYWDTNTAWAPLNDGTTARANYTTGMNPLQNQYILGPFSWSLNASLFKVVPIRERMNLRLNADFFNVLNRPGIPQPGTNGVIDMNASANSPRVLQATARLTW